MLFYFKPMISRKFEVKINSAAYLFVHSIFVHDNYKFYLIYVKDSVLYG